LPRTSDSAVLLCAPPYRIAAWENFKVKLDRQITGLNRDVQTADDKIAETYRAGAKRWKEFEGDVNAATARVRKWIETAAG
jgi:hypothetical protein